MELTLNQLTDLLNMDLELEYSAAIQYINHSAVMTGAAYGDIIKELKIHVTEEIQHAMTLADQIDYLGGSPTVSVGKILTDTDNDEMLRQDLAGEEDAIIKIQAQNRASRVTKGIRPRPAAKNYPRNGAGTRNGPEASPRPVTPQHPFVIPSAVPTCRREVEGLALRPLLNLLNSANRP